MKAVEKLKEFLAIIAAFLKRLGQGIAKGFYKIFPRRAAKYFDADLHEIRYILLMALVALAINLYIEWFARLSTGVFEGFRWSLTHPVIFLYNMLLLNYSHFFLNLIYQNHTFSQFLMVQKYTFSDFLQRNNYTFSF